MFSLASPFFSRRRIRRYFHLKGNWNAFCEKVRTQKPPQLLLIPHQTLSEALVFLPFLLKLDADKLLLGIIYRPFKRRVLEEYVRRTRGRFGVRLFPRKGGLIEASHVLRKGGCVGLLFDQYAGGAGTLTTLCGRITSSTLLPEILRRDIPAEVFIVHAHRESFWKATFEIEPLGATPGTLTDGMDSWLENHLLNDEPFCRDWLWMHNRWKRPLGEIFNLHAKKSNLEQSCKLHGWTSLPKQLRIFVRMPERISEICMVLPILRAIGENRPDAHVSVLCDAIHGQWLESLPFIDRAHILPPKGFGYFRNIRQMRKYYPDLHISLVDSFRGDLEAWLIGAPVRMGMLRPFHRFRPLLTHKLSPRDCPATHMTLRWQGFFRHFGLNKNFSLATINNARATQRRLRIGFCSSLGYETLDKNWPLFNWKHLAAKLMCQFPEAEIVPVGIENVLLLVQNFGEKMFDPRENCCARQIPIGNLIDEMLACSVVIASDLDGAHLANANGIPTVAILGRGDPGKIGPIYDAPREVFSHPSGYASIDPEQVSKAAVRLLRPQLPPHD
jgi:ADP-heptose:LPS heptosyltransferase/lauroyl/myristoyl acyltransferase